MNRAAPRGLSCPGKQAQGIVEAGNYQHQTDEDVNRPQPAVPGGFKLLHGEQPE